MKCVSSALFKKRCVSSRGIDLRASLPFHISVAADMIVMSMTRENNLDVLKLESQSFDVGTNNWGRLFKTCVEQDVAVRGCDQVTSQIISADVIDIADDTKWLEWLI